MPAKTTKNDTRWRRVAHRFADQAAGVSPQLVAAVVPAEMLQQDEIVLILTKPSLWFILLTSFRFMVATVLLGVLAVNVVPTAYMSRQSLALITVLICLGRLVWALLVWSSHIYMLTNLRLVTIKGVVNVRMFQANLRKIQRTVLYQPLLLRFFGMGTIGLATAATETFDSTWVMIGRPLAIHEQIVAAINKAQ